MPQLDTSTFPSQLFWLAVCFLALYLILSYIAVPKITRVLETREEKIEAQINQASLYREQAESLLADYEKILADAKDQAHRYYKSIETAASIEIAHKQKDLMDTLHDQLRLAEQDLYRARLEASQELPSVAIEVASSILTKLIGKSYSPADLLKIKGKD